MNSSSDSFQSAGLPPPLPASHQTPPKAIDQRPGGSGTVHVTYALPGLRRAVVSVPEDRWLVGGHARLAGPLAAALRALDLQDTAPRRNVSPQGEEPAT